MQKCFIKTVTLGFSEAPMLNDSMHTVLTKWEISEGKRYMRDTKLQSLGIS